MFIRMERNSNIGKHICELRKTSQSQLQRLPPNTKYILRLKRAIQKLVIASDHHPFTKYNFQSQAAIAFEKERHGNNFNWWIIHPYSRVRFLWDDIMTIVFLYFFIVVPHIKSFFRICNREINHQYYLTYTAYVFCIFDIAMNFITGSTSPADGARILLNVTEIARYYTQGFFLIDLITSIPYTWFIHGDVVIAPGENVNFFLIIAELIPLLKIFRIKTLRHNIMQINAACGCSSKADISIWLILLTALIIHWSACLTWAFPFVVLHATRTPIEDSDITAVKNNIYNQSIAKTYLTSLHMGLSNLVGSNFIEIQEISCADKLIRCTLLLFGTGYTIYLIVVILRVVESRAQPEFKYEEIIQRVKEYSNEKNLPRGLEKKLMLLYQHRFGECYFQENSITKILPKHLRQEIDCHSNHNLLKASVFNDVPKNFFIQLLGFMESTIYQQDDVVYKAGSEGDCMYFIVTGTVAIINSRGKEMYRLEDGNHFGEINLIYPHRHRDESAIAIEICELLRLERRHFTRFISRDCKLYNQLASTAAARIAQIARTNKISDKEDNQRKRQSSELRRLLMKTNNITEY